METLRDKSAAQTLLEEVELAKLHHPSSRQDSAFLSRSAALAKRLEMRENPASQNSYFPRPTHHLFRDQDSANESIVQTLASELTLAREQAQEAAYAAKEHHAKLEAVKKVESTCKSASELISRLETFSDRLKDGTESTAGDSSPPNLDSEACLHSQSHSVYLALFPSLFDELGQAIEVADKTILGGRAAIADLPRIGIDAQFILDSAATVDRLADCHAAVSKERDTMSHRVGALNKCRSMWSAMATTFDKLDGLRYDMTDAIQKQMHRQQATQDAALLTPESPTSPVVCSQLSVSEADALLDTIGSALQNEVIAPLNSIAPSVGAGLQTYLSNCTEGLTMSVEESRRISRSWSLVQKQALEMNAVRDETHVLQMRSEHLKVRYDDRIQEILEGKLSGDTALLAKDELEEEVALLRADIQAFQDGLSLRVPFIGTVEPSSARSSPSTIVRRRFSASTGFSLDVVRQAAQAGTPFDAAALDRGVRADANSYSMLLAGESDALAQKAELYRLAQLARTIDETAASILEDLKEVNVSLEAVQSSLSSTDEPLSLEHLSPLAEEVDELYRGKGHSIASTCIAARDLLDQLELGCARCDPSFESSMSLPRRRAVEDLEERFNIWREGVEVLSERVSDLQHMEQVRLAEFAKRRGEEERLRLEAQARSQQERIEKEIQERIEAARLQAEAEEEARAEEQRKLAEERAKVDQEAALAAAAAVEKRKLVSTNPGDDDASVHLEMRQHSSDHARPSHEAGEYPNYSMLGLLDSWYHLRCFLHR